MAPSDRATRGSSRPLLRLVPAALALVSLGLLGLLGPPAVQARPGGGVEVRVAHGVSLGLAGTPDSAGLSPWRGQAEISREGRIRGQRAAWGPWRIRFSAQADRCDVAGCWTTVISTLDQAGAVIRARWERGLSGAQARSRMIPVAIERFDGPTRLSRHLGMLRLSAAIEAAGPVSSTSSVLVDGTGRLQNTARWVPVAGSVVFSIDGSDTSRGALQVVLSVEAGTLSVTRDTFAPMPAMSGATLSAHDTGVAPAAVARPHPR